jgi:hypothetical protein
MTEKEPSTNHERGDDANQRRHQLRREVIERLPDTPDGPPSQLAVEVVQAMFHSILIAHEAGTSLDPGDAEALADLLSSAQSRPDSALARWGRGEYPELEEVRSEVAELAQRPALYPETREATNWLANAALAQNYPQLVPRRPEHIEGWQHTIAYQQDLGLTVAAHYDSEPDDQARAAAMDAAEQLALTHGTPALAFLRMPDVDALDPKLEQAFAARYGGSFADLRSFFDAAVNAHGHDEDGRFRPLAFDQLTGTQQSEAVEAAGAVWALVHVAGELHAFLRQTPRLADA